MDELTERAWHALCDKWSSAGYASLTPHEQTWLNVRALVDSIENGGLVSYFFNSGADSFADMMLALTQLEALDVRDQIQRVSALFPDGVSTDQAVRNEQIESWSDDAESLLEDVDERLMPKMSDLKDKLEGFLVRRGLKTSGDNRQDD